MNKYFAIVALFLFTALNQAGGAEEVQSQPGRAEQLVDQGVDMGDQGQHPQQRQQGARGVVPLAEAHALVGSGAGVKTGGGEAGQQRMHSRFEGDSRRR